MVENYNQLIQQITSNINKDLQTIINKQLTLLVKPVSCITRFSLITNIDDQYFNYNILVSS